MKRPTSRSTLSDTLVPYRTLFRSTIAGEYAAFNEISVKRTVGRDSTSNYYLNGARCRRRDITDLFLGTGLGPRSYSIIEQGTISQIIDARPRSEEHTSELQSLMRSSYAVFCLKTKNKQINQT